MFQNIATRPARQQLFDCPACHQRMVMAPEHEQLPLKCAACATVVWAPPFFRRRAQPFTRIAESHVRARCPACDLEHAADPRWIGKAFACTACGTQTPVNEPAGWRWQRPVAKYLTKDEQRWSLHHRMLAATRTEFADSALEPKMRRRFEFYCGFCGALHEARRWDIASQTACKRCEVLMIIPPPLPVQRSKADVSRTSEPPGAETGPRFCPQCGAARTASKPEQRCRRCAHPLSQ